MRLSKRQNGGNGRQEEPTIQHLLVPFTNTPEDQQLLCFACRVAQALKAKLTVVYVLEVPRSICLQEPNVPGKEEGGQILQAAKAIIREMGGVQHEVQMFPAHHAGQAIVEKALQLKVDAILIGAHQQRRLELTLLGDTTDAVLKKAHCQVWVHRSPISPMGGAKK